MTKTIIKSKYTGLLFGEGCKDKKFLQALSGLEKFKYYTQNWEEFSCDHAFGGSPRNILEQCRKVTYQVQFNIIICFIDLDKLKKDFPKTWQKEKDKLEKEYSDFSIVWQLDNAEEEYKKFIGEQKDKNKLNKLVIKRIKK